MFSIPVTCYHSESGKIESIDLNNLDIEINRRLFDHVYNVLTGQEQVAICEVEIKIKDLEKLMHQRKAVSVFPKPVGEKMSVFFPSVILGQLAIYGGEGMSNVSRNHVQTYGSKSEDKSLNSVFWL